MGAFQGLFRTGRSYVAVRYIRLSADTRVEPGTPLPSKKYPLREHELRHLFAGRRIGVKGSPWAEAMLEAVKNNDTRALPELTNTSVSDPTLIADKVLAQGKKIILDVIGKKSDKKSDKKPSKVSDDSGSDDNSSGSVPWKS